MYSPKGSNLPKRVVFDVERMKYSNTGLYYFCLHLAQALIKSKPPNIDLNIYGPQAIAGLFEAGLIKQNSFHKLVMPFSKQYDLWHVTYQGSHYFPYSSGKKIILTVHDLNFLYDEHKTVSNKKKYLAALQRKIARADRITAISHFTKHELKQHLDLKGKEPVVIYNGSNIDGSLKAVPPKHIPVAPFLFTIGTIVDKKNFHVLPGLLLNNNYTLVIAGITQSETYKNKIIETAERLEVMDRITFTGAIQEEEKIWYLQNCLAFAFPSLAEGFGLPVIEAMSFGKPVLLSKYSSLPEIGGDHAYYFDNFDPEHMSSLLERSLMDHQQHNRSAAVKTWASQFNWDNAAVQYLNLYNELLNE